MIESQFNMDVRFEPAPLCEEELAVLRRMVEIQKKRLPSSSTQMVEPWIVETIHKLLRAEQYWREKAS